MPYQPQVEGQISVDGPDLRLRETGRPESELRVPARGVPGCGGRPGTNLTDSRGGGRDDGDHRRIYRAAGMEVREPS